MLLIPVVLAALALAGGCGDQAEAACTTTCPEGQSCLDGECVAPCNANADCDGGFACFSGVCKPVPGADCARDSDCNNPEPCEGYPAICDAGHCEYPAKTCSDPPAAECLDSDSTFRAYASSGTCDPDTGSCFYEHVEVACPDCSANCYGPCDADTLAGCDDGNPCTADACDPQGGCRHIPMADGAECGARTCDASLNWTKATCQSGTCTGSSIVQVCNDANVCTVDACDPISGCSYAAVTDGTECGLRSCDGSLTYNRQACVAGSCSGTAVVEACDDGNDCTTDTCTAATGCGHGNVADGAECGARFCDTDLAWTEQICAAGACTGSLVLQACDDGNECTADACDGASGCDNTSLTDGTECGARSCDGSLNWNRQACLAGTCTGVALVQACDDGDPCTADACDAATGCSNGGSCCTLLGNTTYCGENFSLWNTTFPTSINCAGGGSTFSGWENMAVPTSFPVTIPAGTEFAAELSNQCWEWRAWTCDPSGQITWYYEDGDGITNDATCPPGSPAP